MLSLYAAFEALLVIFHHLSTNKFKLCDLFNVAQHTAAAVLLWIMIVAATASQTA